MLNSKRWKQLREWKLQQNPLCELCEAEGFVRSAIDVHHKTPCESARTLQEMERLCYNPNNCVLLCIPCHQRVHVELMSKTKEKVKERRAQAFERWKDKLKGNNNEQTRTDSKADSGD